MDASGTDNCISEITLEYLMNKEQYAKYLEQRNPAIKSGFKKDRRFYRKRIYDLSRQLLSNEAPEQLMPDVKYAFENYVNTCVNYFKVLDRADIIQEDYANLEIDIKNEIKIDGVATIEEANQLMMRSIKMTNPPTLLTNFITIKNAQPEKEPITPQQKDINLKDPLLKNKGILKNKKKKNITNI